MSERRHQLVISDDAVLDVANLASAAFAPLTGFMTRRDYTSVVEEMRCADGSPWTIPITLDVPEGVEPAVRDASRVQLCDRSGRSVAELDVEDVFRIDLDNDLPKIFGTDDRKHPGLQQETARSPWRVGGRVHSVEETNRQYPKYDLLPAETARLFRAMGWRTVVGFQTRNPPHRAHEYLHRIALELFDGLFIQPLVGWKKAGDFAPAAVMAAYELQIARFYPRSKVVLGTLRTAMRYAGAREAVFHALIRRNYGCTHFIVGRDHAGVGNYYGKYEAQDLCRRFPDLGITVLALGGPYFCTRCAAIVTDRSCGCGEEFAQQISGTLIRDRLRNDELPPAVMMRGEIGAMLVELNRDKKLWCE